jgi:hypothetical protein
LSYLRDHGMHDFVYAYCVDVVVVGGVMVMMLCHPRLCT